MQWFQQSRTFRDLTDAEKAIAFRFPDGVDLDTDGIRTDTLSQHTIFTDQDRDLKVQVQAKLFSEEKADGGFTAEQSRCLGSIMGMVVCDSLGSPLEFSPVRYGVDELKDLEQDDVWHNPRYNRFRLRPGQWTDDASMGLCLADSLLVNHGFVPTDLRLRFLNWWRFGYRNAFGWDTTRRAAIPSGANSVGLGGNIGASLDEFERRRTEYTTAGNINTSGNGSLMRCAPAPVFFHRDPQRAMQVAYQQSKTTHQGEEAAETCRLLAHVICSAINAPGTPNKDDILGNLGSKFTSPLYSVQCLASSEQEQPHADNKDFDLKERNWNWKDPNYRYAPGRSKKQPGYIGSYAMDNISMALHCVFTTSTFREAALKCANMRGDSDSVCSVVGQIAGALYGIEAIPKSWIKCVQRWDNGGDVALTAFKLCEEGSKAP